MTVLYTYLDSPIGPLLLAGDGEALCRVGFPRGKGKVAPQDGWMRDDTAFVAARSQLSEYFAGTRRTFDLPLAPIGTAFQVSVWTSLALIPFGKTWSYGELARHVGRPGASRAVGAANGANPLPIVLPCHRVIGSDGSLTGFGGGIETKRWLLALEATGTPPDDNQLRLI
jgi:methylated-DNA-[protein]-cysteine S-methyltransferase